MSNSNGLTDETDTAPEYVGGVKFGPVEGEPVEAQSTIEDWYRFAREEFILTRVMLPYLNGSDDDIERMVREADDPDEKCEEFLTLIETCQHWEGRYRAGAEVMSAVAHRLIVICERQMGKELVEKLYAEKLSDPPTVTMS